MKKNRVRLLVIILMMTFTLPIISYAHGGDYSYDFPIESGDEDGDDGDDVNPPDKGRRSWQMGQICTINSQNGVRIPGVDKNDILTYEIWNSCEECVAVFCSEGDFLSFLPSVSGNVRIVFRLPSTYLYGYVTL